MRHGVRVWHFVFVHSFDLEIGNPMTCDACYLCHGGVCMWFVLFTFLCMVFFVALQVPEAPAVSPVPAPAAPAPASEKVCTPGCCESCERWLVDAVRVLRICAAWSGCVVQRVCAWFIFCDEW